MVVVLGISLPFRVHKVTGSGFPYTVQPEPRNIVGAHAPGLDWPDMQGDGPITAAPQTDFAAVFRNSVRAAAVIDADHRMKHVNAAFCRALGRPETRLVDFQVFDFIEKEEGQRRLAAAFERALAQNRTEVVQIDFSPSTSGSGRAAMPAKSLTLHCTPLAGHARGVLCEVADTASLCAVDDAQDIAAAAQQHRIGNLLNVVQILARRTGQTSASLDEFLPAFDARIGALGRTHAALSARHRDGMTLRDLLDQQLSGQRLKDPDACHISGPDWVLSALHAQIFSIAIHELIVNALTHGALGTKGGQVRISWTHSNTRHRFIWRETGMPDLSEPTRQGFGMQMLTLLLPAQLGGQGRCDFAPDGFVYTLDVPNGDKAQG